MDNFSFTEWLATMFILVIAITIHEFAHAIAAYRCGDDTPRLQGRLSINPMDHLDPIGTVMMAISTATGYGLGWGKPVQYNPGALRHPRRDAIIIAICGPISNLLQALAFALVLHINRSHSFFNEYGSTGDLLWLGVTVNLSLMFFNMIPIPPLDGSKVLSNLLTLDHAQLYEATVGRFGLILFMLLIITHAAGYIIGPPTMAVTNLLLK